jgi:hypothetical protein
MNMIDNNEIIAVAALLCKANKSDSEEDAENFGRALDSLVDVDSVALVFCAAKLMEGKPYGVHSNNPETVKRYRALAQHLGASVTEAGARPLALRTLRIDPPSRQ